jgi:hypothetical protein
MPSFLLLLADKNQLVSPADRKRAQQYGVHYAEDGGVGSHPQGESKNRNSGETSVLSHHAKRMPRRSSGLRRVRAEPS